MWSVYILNFIYYYSSHINEKKMFSYDGLFGFNNLNWVDFIISEAYTWIREYKP